MTALLQVSDVSVRLGGRNVLHDVSFDVEAGQLIGLIGPNGAGKTTLMRAINGLIPTSGGTITRHAKLGYVPQSRQIEWDYPMSLEQLVATSFIPHRRWYSRLGKAQWQAVYQALETVGLAEYSERALAELSGGQKQRLLVARALVTQPSLLLLDEPFTGLDHPNQDSLTDLFTSLAEQGVGIIMSTHDLPGAVDMCSHLLMLNRSIRAYGTPAELRDPQLWMDTYSVRADSSLLKSLGLA
ncbi:metal ABC transporter ATP-binding protein [Arcanobacterium phocae]|uniref:Manganese/iron transport system ATP-binding protein n=1 Tax=Arcanobacterium phocae TaxID=131112 RepID=A0A1H2LP53_9ACTO|nr:ABC transporter ATP-binding protein [Arcanobacterium phocae]SDU82535.1 manganese/iron transport system ATP-binding protein [Arcanobacterium phocae]